MRTLNAAAQALRARALAGEQIPRIPLIFFDLPAPQRWAVCGVPLVWGGHTWAPLDIAMADVADELGTLNNLRFTLPAVTTAELSLAMQDVEGAAVEVRWAYVDPATAEVVDAMLLFSGELDQPGWQDGPQALAHFSAVHRGNLAGRLRPTRYTNDEQQRLYPGDTGFDVDPLTDGAPLVWPAAGFYKIPLGG